MIHFFVLGLFLAHLKLHFLVLNSLEVIEVTLVVGQLLVKEVDDFLNCSIEEVTSVRHNNDCDLQLLNVVFQPDKSIEIQVIGRLVE